MTKWPKNCPTKNAFSLSGSITPPRKVITGTCGPVDFISEVKIEVARAESGEIDAEKTQTHPSFTLLDTPARSGTFGVARLFG